MSDDSVLILVQPSTDVTVLVQEDVIILTQPADVVTTLIEQEQILILQADGGSGPAGAAGPPGAPGGRITAIAGQNITAYKAVGLRADGKLYLVDSSTLSDQYIVAGISLFAANTGESLDVVTDGLLVTPALWTAGPLYVGPTGTLVGSAPATGFYLRIATASNSTELIVRPQEPITRA